jgi:hypothetical protein
MTVVGVAYEGLLKLFVDAQPLGHNVVVVLFVLKGFAEVVDACVQLADPLLEELLVLGPDLLFY